MLQSPMTLKDFHYDFARKGFFDRANSPVSKLQLLDATRAGKPGATGIGKDSGRAAILIQSLISEEGGRVGDGGILQAILDHAGSIVSESGGLKGSFSRSSQYVSNLYGNQLTP